MSMARKSNSRYSRLGLMATCLLFSVSKAQVPGEKLNLTTYAYYTENWQKSTRTLTQDSADFIGLPYPYSTPTLAGNVMFREMYYWDTYFINRGLLAYGLHKQRRGDATDLETASVQQAIHNVNNLLFLVDRYGFVPNANRFSMTNRSQPPLLGAMIADVYAATGDTAWLRKALKGLETEHAWWMEARFFGLSFEERTRAPHALGYNHYGHNANDAFLLRFGRFLKGRLGDPFDSMYQRRNTDSFRSSDGTLQPKGIQLLGHMLAEAESGWDFTPRFHARCMNIAPLDLNCLLYLTEKILYQGYKTLGDGKKSKHWKSIASKRKELINNIFYDKHTGWYWDYDIALGRIHRNYNAAQFMPYFAGIAPQTAKHKKALLRLSQLFIGPYGIHPCLPILSDSASMASHPVQWKTQWNSPNAWPPLTHFAAEAINNYDDGIASNKTQRGLQQKRFELMQGLLFSVETQFQTTGKFWEKYNLHTGGLDVANEYAMPDFFGWTAGVYLEYHLEFVGP